jgi:hypothetical protein
MPPILLNQNPKDMQRGALHIFWVLVAPINKKEQI